MRINFLPELSPLVTQADGNNNLLPELSPLVTQADGDDGDEDEHCGGGGAQDDREELLVRRVETCGVTKETFYLTTHSTHFIYGFMASDIW